MDVVSPGPFRVASLLFQPRPRVFALTVICRATFHLEPVEAQLADDQDPPAEEDNYWDDDPSRSLYAPSDLVPFKPRAEVLLVGNAFAPRKEPVRSLMVRLLVGEVDKSIEVFGERAFTLDGQLREGPRFSRMPLRYERAAGGPDTDNPVGLRLDLKDGHGMTQVPNLQPPGLFISQLGEHIAPIGFGPIAPSWPTRRERLGRHAGVWPPARVQAWAERPLPADIDSSYFNAAPRDQQLESLRDNERIILENLHPEHARLTTSLPGIRPRGVVERNGAQAEEVQLSADTLWIDTDRSLCAVIWRGQVRLEHPEEAGRVLISLDARRRSIPDLSWSSGDAASAEAGQTLVPHRKKAKVLPFVEARPEVSPMARATTAWTASDGDVGSTTMSLEGDLDAIEAQAEGPDETQSLGNEAMNAMLSEVHGRPTLSSSLPFVPAATPPPRPSSAGQPPPLPPPRPSQTGAPPRPAPSSPPPARPFIPPPTPSAPAAPTFGPPPVAPVAPVAPTFGAPTPPAEIAPPALVRPQPQAEPIRPQALSSPWSSNDLPAGPRPSAEAPAAAQISPRLATDAARAPNMAGSGLLAASNAAASEPAPIEEPTPSAPASPAPASEARPARGPAKELVQLLWFDPKSAGTIRKQRAFRPIIAALERERDAEEEDDDDDDLPAEGSPEHWDNRSVLAVIVRAQTIDGAGVREAMASAVGEDGRYQPPLVLVAGELIFPFDELASLKAMVTAMTPLAAGDKKLKEAVDTVTDLLKAPWPEGSGRIAEGLGERLKEAFAQGKRMIPPDYLESHTERMVLGERRYQRRSLLGDTWIRSLFRPGGSGEPIPAYLPDKLARELPMFPRFGARLIAEVTMQQDPYETSPLALRVVALARTLAVPKA